MINTDKEIGVYTDFFGNEITEYEHIEKYSIIYEGFLFEGDSSGLNIHGYDRWEDALAIYNSYPDMITIRDNEYGVSFKDGDWF